MPTRGGLVGRRREQQQLARLIDGPCRGQSDDVVVRVEPGIEAVLLTDARAGRSGVLVLRGEAGIGKTSLLEFAHRGVAHEQDLHQIGCYVPQGTTQ